MPKGEVRRRSWLMPCPSFAALPRMYLALFSPLTPRGRSGSRARASTWPPLAKLPMVPSYPVVQTLRWENAVRSSLASSAMLQLSVSEIPPPAILTATMSPDHSPDV